MGTHIPSFTFDSPSDTAAPPAPLVIAGFWRRLIAFLLDGLILATIGWLIGNLFSNTFVSLGAWGRLVGFLIGVPYFAITESQIGGGKSIGKRLLNLRVVDKQGNTLQFEMSFFRYAVLSAPWFLNKLALPASRTPWEVFLVLGIIVFGIGGGTLYLLIFNRNTRQGLHDLAVGSYVTRAEGTGPLETQSIWRTHWVIVGLVLLAPLATGSAFRFISNWAFFPELMQDLQLVERLNWVQQGGVFRSTRYTFKGSSERSLSIQATCAGQCDNPASSADQVARLILEHDTQLNQYDQLAITISRGYDIGIFQAWQSRTIHGSLAEWHEHLFGISSGPGPAKMQE